MTTTTDLSLLNYFAAHEPTAPPESFFQKEIPPNPLKSKNGAPLPTSDPTPQEMAAVLAKWRFMVAAEMVKEAEKRQ